MKKLYDLALAGFAFVRALFVRRDPVKNFSQNGHSILEGWDHAPDEEIIQRALAASRKAPSPARVALFGYAGPAQGELIPLRGTLLTAGTATTNQVVLTPCPLGTGHAGPFPFELSNGTRVSAPHGQKVRVNGRDEELCELYDYDRVELCGNHFLFLDMGGAR